MIATDLATGSRIEEIRQEVLDSEQSYVESLRYLMAAYVLPLKDNGILSHSESKTLFSSISLIVNVNGELLTSLESRNQSKTGDKDHQCIGEVFLEFAPYLKLYTQYSAQYDEALRALETFKSEKPAFASFLAEVSARAAETGHHQHISFFLIMPIQRIPRYIMLLSDLLNHTDDSHPDHLPLSAALDQVREVAAQVNDSIKKVEFGAKMRLIQENMTGFDGQLVLPSRRLLRDGVLVHKVSKSGNLIAYTIYLFNDFILLTKGKPGRPQIFKQDIPLHLTWPGILADVDSKSIAFLCDLGADQSVIVHGRVRTLLPDCFQVDNSGSVGCFSERKR